MQINISELLPHRDPFILITALIASDKKETISQFKIDPNHVLVDNNLLTEGGLIEHIAQTAAAGLAYQENSLDEMEANEPKIGYLGQVKNLKIHQLPSAGEVIETKTTNVTQIMNAHIVQAEVFLKDILIAEAEVRVFVQV